jgi:hypothetical protein
MLDQQWFQTLEQDLHTADMEKQHQRMLEIVETGYTGLRSQYAGDEAMMRKIEAAYVWLKAQIQRFDGQWPRGHA